MNNNKDIPLVSVVIPTFNRAHLILKSINSVLQQTYKNIELIIVDDASSDNTEEVVTNLKDERIRYVKQEKNLGPSVARNKGIELANGKFVAFLDSDDQWYPDKIEKQVNLLMKSDESVGAVFCGMEFYDFKTNERIGEHLITVDIKENFTKGKYFLTPPMVTILAYKNILQEIGGFDDRLKANEDTELAIKICKKYNFALVKEILVKVTRNHKQLMTNNENYISAREIIFDKHYDFLSKDILFGLAKQIANYNILKNNFVKAKDYTKKALEIKPTDFKTILQLFSLSLSPALTKRIFSAKHKNAAYLSGLKTN